MVVSSRHNGWVWDEANTRLSCYVRGTEVLRVDDTSADLALLSNGLGGLAGKHAGMINDALLALGTGNDVALVQRSTVLSAGTELAGVIVGTSVLSAIPANSLIISDVTASGDLVFAARTSTNSLEYFRADSSGKDFLVNEASNDINFRVKSVGNANAIFVDAGNNRVGIFTAAPGVALDITGAMSSSGIISTDEWQTTGGGTVTQTTSKGTGFTLNTSTGVVTMNNSSVTGGAEVVSVFTNSTISANSVMVLCHAASGAGNTEAYYLTAGNFQDGSCEITVANLSAGALGDAIQFNFVVIGGASS